MTKMFAAAGAFLVLGCLWMSALASPALSAPVAYVDRFSPTGAEFHVERGGRRVPIIKRNVDLDAGDQIYVDTQDAVILVRYIADNAVAVVRQRAGRGQGAPADYTVGQSALPGLKGVLLAWFETELSGADQGGGALTATATRGGALTDVCFNETGRTDDPTSFNVPILRADKSQIAAGERPIFVSWRGGAAPYSVTLAKAETGEIVVQSKDIRGGCWTRLPASPLAVGRYKLTVMDANGAKEEEGSLFVVDGVPSMPQPLRDAQIPDDARNLYYATWLSAKDAGEWAFEAQQLVAQMDCHSAAVQQWLRRWGDVPACN